MSLAKNFADLAENCVFSYDYIQEFKKILENQEGEELLFIENSKELSIRCSNHPINICPFEYRFVKKTDMDSKETGLQFKKCVNEHSSQCKVNDQQFCFQRNSILIEKQNDLIQEVMISRFHLYGAENPKAILEAVNKELCLQQEGFIFKGLKNKMLKSKMKKKFDNLVKKIRTKFNIPASCQTNGKIKKNKQKKKPKLSLSRKNVDDFDVNEQKSPDDYFASDESNPQSSEYKPEVCLDSIMKNPMLIRKYDCVDKTEVKQEENSYDYIENDPNTYESFGAKTKFIKKL